ENVRVSLALVDAIGKDVGWRRFSYMLREAETQTREAPEPGGFYSPQTTVERRRPDRTVVVPGEAQGQPAPSARGQPGVPADGMSLTIRVDPGEPVRVRNADIAIVGEGNGDQYLQQDLDDFLPGPGSIFNHADYEASKTRISRR